MKRVLLLLFPAVLLILLTTAGCNDESEPRFSRITVYPACGVAPLQVDCRAEATGGNETGDPTGGNNNLEISWDFGDGSSGSNTSVSYHTFTAGGEYRVVVTAKDPDGKSTSTFQMVQVYDDTLTIDASNNLDGAAAVSDTVYFDLRAESCFVDPDNEADYRNLFFSWKMNDGSEANYSSHRPRHRFSTAGTYAVTVDVSFPYLSATRHDTLIVEVVDP